MGFDANRLVSGAREYRKARRDSELEDMGALDETTKAVRKELRHLEESSDLSSCSICVRLITSFSENATSLRYILRTPGAFWSDGDGNLSPEAARYLAIAAERGRMVSHTHHGNCAMGATCAYNKDQNTASSKLPEDFQLMGKDRKKLARTVLGFDAKTGKYRPDEATVSLSRKNGRECSKCRGLLWSPTGPLGL